jgi:hypothetical protein
VPKKIKDNEYRSPNVTAPTAFMAVFEQILAEAQPSSSAQQS